VGLLGDDDFLEGLGESLQQGQGELQQGQRELQLLPQVRCPAGQGQA